MKSILEERAVSYVMRVLRNLGTKKVARSSPVGGLGIVVKFVDPSFVNV